MIENSSKCRAVNETRVLTVQSPAGGQVLWGELVGAPTTDGFAWQLNGVTDATTYKLHYAIVL